MRVADPIPGPLGRRRLPGRLQWRLWIEPPLALLLSFLPRAIDLAASGLLLVLASPAWAAAAGLAFVRTGRVFDRAERIGRFHVPFEQLRFAGEAPGAGLAVLLNVLRGDMALVGPRPLPRQEAEALGPEYALRFALRPGLVSPFALRRKVGIAYDGEARSDLEFYYGETAQGNLGLGARFLIGQVLAGGAERPAPAELDFFGVTIANTTMDEALDWIAGRVRNRQPGQLAFVNPDCLNIAFRHEAYRHTLQTAARVLPDGIGIHLGCRILGVALRENVNGTDLFPRLCERAAGEGLSLYLLGARPGIAAAAAAEMQRRYPELKIAGSRDGYFSAEETGAAIDAINRSRADILLVAFGAPRQELWIAEHAAELATAVRMGVGGLFDFYSGRIPRAPLWMREIGLEWVYRLMQEPGRMWRRYVIGNPLFLFRVWRQRLQGTNP